jgi:hypothetical protein
MKERRRSDPSKNMSMVPGIVMITAGCSVTNNAGVVVDDGTDDDVAGMAVVDNNAAVVSTAVVDADVEGGGTDVASTAVVDADVVDGTVVGSSVQVAGWPVQDDLTGHVSVPELMPTEGLASVDVCTIMPSVTLAPLLPMVNPLMVILNANDELMEVPEIVKTKAVLEVVLQTAERPVTLLAPAATVGMTEGAKKLEGYVRVIVPPEGMAVYGVKAREMGTEDFPTTRSEAAMVNETEETAGEKMLPDDKAFDTEHMFVRNLIATEPAVGGPIVKPRMVIVTTANAVMAAPDVTITTASAEVALHDADRPATLLAPESTEGITEEAKKLEGYERVIALPETMDRDGEKTRVAETDDLPDKRSEEEIPNVDRRGVEQTCVQSNIAVGKETKTGVVIISVMEPLPTWPLRFHPQHDTAPLLDSAQL